MLKPENTDQNFNPPCYYSALSYSDKLPINTPSPLPVPTNDLEEENEHYDVWLEQKTNENPSKNCTKPQTDQISSGIPNNQSTTTYRMSHKPCEHKDHHHCQISHTINASCLTSSPTKSKYHVKRAVLDFCETTTIRGIGHIVKTKDGSIRTLWITFFLILCIGLLASQTMLIKQFFEYNVIHPPRVLRNAKSPFPSITLCNHRPLQNNIKEFLSKRKMRNPREFATIANQFAKYNYYDQKKEKEYYTLTPSFSLNGYLESIPLDMHYLLGHQLNDLIIQCSVTYQEGSKHMIGNCATLGEWLLVPHPQYINCFTYSVNPNISLDTTTLELYIYLNEETNTSKCYDCFKNNVKSQLSGALLVIHNSRSMPNINQEAINLQPGTLTEVRIKTFLNQMLTHPYGRCDPDTEEFLKMGNKVYAYTEQACKFKTIQTEINKECFCNTVEFELVDPFLPFCTNFSSFIYYNNCDKLLTNSSTNIDKISKQCMNEMNEANKKLSCKSNVTVKYSNDIIKLCNLPCSYYSYESDRSISSWPTKTWQLTWLSTNLGRYTLNKPELIRYREALDLFNRKEDQAAMDIINNLSLLEKKLVALVINKPNKNLHKVEEKAVLSLTSFLSQLGGLFSIWIGLTLITIVEIIELLFKFFKIARARFVLFSSKIPDRKNNNNDQSIITFNSDNNNNNNNIQIIETSINDSLNFKNNYNTPIIPDEQVNFNKNNNNNANVNINSISEI